MKKKIIFLSIFIVVLLLGGVGIFFITQFNKKPITWADVEAKYKTTLTEVPTDGSTPNDHTSMENVAYFLWKIENTENFASTTTGTAMSAGQKQEIYNKRVVTKERQMIDTVSTGVITTGKQKYFLDGKVLLRDFKSKDGDQITWKNDAPECITNKGYISRYGWLPTQCTAYIICQETVLEYSELTVLDNGLYSISLSLNPNEEYAPFWYQREVAENASAKGKPKFSSISVEYIFDDAWVVHEVHTQEKYNITPGAFPMPVDCTTNVVEVFDYDHPQLNAEDVAWFKPYESMEPTDGEVEVSDPTALEYITKALISADGSDAKFDVNIQLNEQQLSGKLALNLADLNNINLKFSLDKLNVHFQDQTIYLDMNQVKLKTTTAGITDLLAPVLESLTASETEDSSSESLDLAAIMQDFDSAEMTVSEQHISISVKLHLLGMEVPLSFEISKNNDQYQMESIAGSLEVSSVHIGLSLTKNDSLEFAAVQGEYCDISNLKFMVDDVVSILQNGVAELEVSGAYRDISVSGNILLDFQDGLSLTADVCLGYQKINEQLVISYQKDWVYLDYRSVHIKVQTSQLMDLLSDFGIEFDPSSFSLDINQVLNTVLSIDYSVLLENLIISENGVDISLGLSALFENLETLHLVIENTDAGFDIKANYFDLQAKVQAHTDREVVIDDTQYSTVDVLLDSVAYLGKLINKESIRIDIHQATAQIKLKEKTYPIVLNASVDLVLKEGTYDVLGVFDVTVTDQMYSFRVCVLDNVLYLSFEEEVIALSLDELDSLIEEISARLQPVLNSSGSSDSQSTFSLDFLDQLTIGNNSISFNHLFEDAFNIALTLSLAKDESDVATELLGTLAGNYRETVTFSLPITVRKSSGVVIEVPTGTMVNQEDLLVLIDNIVYLLEMIGKESIHLDLNETTVTLSEKSETLKLSGAVDLVLVDRKYQLSGTIDFVGFGIQLSVGIVLVDQDLYLTVSHQNIHLKINELETFVDQLVSKINQMIEQINSIGNKNIAPMELDFDFGPLNFEFIKSLTLTANSLSLENVLGLGLNVGLMFGLITSQDQTLFSATLSGLYKDQVQFEIPFTLGKSALQKVVVPTTNLIEPEDLLQLCDHAIRLLNIANEKSFVLDLDLSVTDSGFLKMSITGTAEILVYPNGKFDLEANVIIEEFEKTQERKGYHNVHLILLTKEGQANAQGKDVASYENDMLYITYGNNSEDLNSQIKVYTPVRTILDIVDTLTKLLGIDLSFADGLLSEGQEELNIGDLSKLFQKEESEEEKEPMNLSDLLCGISVTSSGLEVVLNGQFLQENLPADQNITVTLNLEETDHSKAALTLKNLYTAYQNELHYTKIDINGITLKKEEVKIDAPEQLDGWYDIGDIDLLVNGLVTTATFKDFAIEGTVSLNAIGIVNVSIPIQIYVKVDDNAAPIVYAHMDMGSLGVGSIIISAKQVYIYYYDGFVYIDRREGKTGTGDRYQIKISYETFLSDIPYYLLSYAMNVGDSIMKLINGAESPEGYQPDAGKIVTQYSSQASQDKASFTFALDMGELTGNTDLGVLQATLGLIPVVVEETGSEIRTALSLNSIDNFSFIMVNAIDLKSDSLKITNIKEKDGYNRVEEIVISGQFLKDFVKSYTDSYQYEVDLSYKNGKFDGKAEHTVFFYPQSDLFPQLFTDYDYSFKGQTGSLFTYPSDLSADHTGYVANSLEVDGEYYHLVGWYTDSEYSQLFEDNLIPNKNLKLYAKWEKMHRLEIVDEFGVGLTQEAYTGQSIKEFYQLYSTTTDSFGNSYHFVGFSLEANGALISPDFTMPNGDLVLYIVWEKITYRLYVDENFVKVLSLTDDTAISELTEEIYEIENVTEGQENRFYGYRKETLTPKFLLEKCSSFAKYEGAFADLYLTVQKDREGYYRYTFDYQMKFTDQKYVSVALPIGEEISAEELPQGVYRDDNGVYNINYWYNDSGELDQFGKFHSSETSLPQSNQTWKAVYATCEYLSYTMVGDQLSVAAFTCEDTTKPMVVILPKYVMFQNRVEIVRQIASFKNGDDITSAFYAGGTNVNQTLKAIFFNDGLISIGGNAFKNCSALTDVYFSATVTDLTQNDKGEIDSFYYNTGNSNQDKAHAEALRFHFGVDSSLKSLYDQKKWLACKTILSSYYYGTSKSGWWESYNYDHSDTFDVSMAELIRQQSMFA